ncbi:MAG: hypothetical protein JO024_06810 [Candidatus Eremiobacteraeota bacterium]|nr:hypothetical protein [Candidatus Eremiobacteraeota bacterium]MBV9737600.1 hypothetical protein [Candidatus Eremiobacteraeota bacterium]
MIRRALPLFAAIALWPLAVQADCSSMPGSQIALFSGNYDPDVLVWDSRHRLLAYATDSYQVAKLLLPHAILARAGTTAVVTSCHRNAIHQKYRPAPSDVVGVRMTSGEYRGRNGWVMVEDVHVTGQRATHRHHP